jgi:hypothetical protein
LSDGRRIYRWYPEGQEVVPVPEIPYDLQGHDVKFLVTTGHGKSGRLMHLDQVWEVADADSVPRSERDEQAPGTTRGGY